MPRPKRSKATPSLTTPRNNKSKIKKSTDVASTTSKSSFNDLYDVSDNEEDRRLRIMDSVNGKDENGQALVSPLAEAFLEMEREQYTEKKNVVTSASGDSSMVEAGPSSSSSSLLFEIGRKEQPTPMRESLALAMGNLKTQVSSTNTDFSKVRSRSEPKSDENKVLGEDTGIKARRSQRRMRQTNTLTSPNSLQNTTQYSPSHVDEFNIDVSTPIKGLNTNISDSSILITSSNSKKRKLSEVQVPQSSFETSPPILSETNEIVPATDPNSIASYGYIEESQKDLLPSVEDRSPTPQDIRDIMAPPHSSSSILSSPVATSRPIKTSNRNLRSLRTRTPSIRIDSDSEISSPPSLTHSPDLPSPTIIKSRDKKPKPSHISMSTAQLKALLPRRRRRIARDVSEGVDSDNEINISGLASDEDELTHLIVGPQVQTRNMKLLKGPQARTSVLRKNPIEISKVNTSTSRTYGSADNKVHSGLTKEIEDHHHKLPVENSDNLNNKPQELDKRFIGQELKKAVQKFKEVDNWALEFEDATSSSASPKDAR
ncbi:hypothetical protein HI914_05038 [Erysiphe necator]|nr:hypothetical protein HI914_05038 [Erysiphe necator]